MSTRTILIITATCFVLGPLLSTDTYAFDPIMVNMTLQDAQTLEFATYDVVKMFFSLFNGDSQQFNLSGHSMIYLNDTTATPWEYSSYMDLDSFTSTDCPILNTTINSGQSGNVQLCFVIPKTTDIGYSLVLNNDYYFKDWETNEFVLESVPSWFATTVDAWCIDTITDADYVNSVEFYIAQGTINVLRAQSGTDIGTAIPAWVKNDACQWSSSQISDYEFLDGIYWLIDNGKITL